MAENKKATKKTAENKKATKKKPSAASSTSAVKAENKAGSGEKST